MRLIYFQNDVFFRIEIMTTKFSSNIKNLPFLIIFSLLLFFSCEKEEVKKSGIIYYALDYPEKKDNFFMYAVLPKKMELRFNQSGSLVSIEKAGIVNQFSISSNEKSVGMYFRYANEEDFCSLDVKDVKEMKKDFVKFEIKLTNKKDTMAGFNVMQAFAVDPLKKSEQIELWYTTELNAPNSNWPTPYTNVPGVLMSYQMQRYGVLTTIKATSFRDKKFANNEVKCNHSGKKRSFSEYNVKMMRLFQSFED
jgi:GLPGLI family protein